MTDTPIDPAYVRTLEERIIALETGRFASLRTGRLTLVDDQDKVRALLMTSGKEVALALIGATGNPAVMISTGDEKTEIAIHNSTGVRRALITLGYESNEPMVALCTADGDPSVALRAADNGPHLMLFDDRQTCRLFLSVEGMMGPRLTLNDDQEMHRLELVAWPGKEAALLIVDENGSVQRVFSAD